jgi:MFS superfamily sulfate permease-like transporter
VPVVDGGTVEVPDSNLRTVAAVLLIVFEPFLTVSLLFLIVFVLFLIVFVLLLSVLMLLPSLFMLLLIVFILFLCVYKAMPIRSLEVDHDIVQSVSTHSIFISLSTPQRLESEHVSVLPKDAVSC